MSDPIPIHALFLGPKSENEDFLLTLITEVLRDHIFWRRNLHVEDDPAIAAREITGDAHTEVHARIKQEVYRLTSFLKREVPYFSPRYLGHMLSDLLMPGVIGYIAALLYNPNNVSAEASRITSRLEVEVGRQIARLMGFGRTEEELARTWGHIASGGTVANLEAVWIAQNVKFHALAVRNAARQLALGDLPIAGKAAADLTVWEALNVPLAETLELTPRLYEALRASGEDAQPSELWNTVTHTIGASSLKQLGWRRFAALFAGEGGLPETPLVLPQTKHYCWDKAPEIFGLGHDQVHLVPVDDHFRQDVTKARELLYRLRDAGQSPLLQVVVCGTTEESAVDAIGELTALRRELEAEGMSYWMHCDAAWGGYARSVFLDEHGDFKTLQSLRAQYRQWPSREVYEAFQAMSEVDSITVDPHKMGYVPYPAGALIFRDLRAREFVSHEAPYVFAGASGAPRLPTPGSRPPGPKGAPAPEPGIHLGRYIMEGSKPGAAAAAVWLCHHVYPLDERGYGNLIGESIQGARYLEEMLDDLGRGLEGRYEVVLVNRPTDLNVVCYCFNPRGNDSLADMNAFNQELYQRLGAQAGRRGPTQEFYVSHTDLAAHEYDLDVLRGVLRKHTTVSPDSLVSTGEKDRLHHGGSCTVDDRITVLRTTVMNPFILAATPEGNYIDTYIKALPDLLEEIRPAWEARRTCLDPSDLA